MLLALDLGTTNIKALVTDAAGQPVSQGACPVSLRYGDGGAVEQDIEEIWEATASAMRQALERIDASAIQSIGVSSQGGALQVLDPQGRPLGPVVSWLDPRGHPEDEALTRELGVAWFEKRIWHRGSWLALGQLARLRKETPAWLKPPNRIGFVGDIVVSRLCGRAAHDGTSAALTLLYNPARRDYDPDVLLRLGIERGQLPALVAAPGPAGGLVASVAERTGLRAGIPVSTAVHDQYAAALGTGVVHQGRAMLGLGTAWVLLAVSDAPPTAVTDHALLGHHVVGGLYGQILSLVNGGSTIAWAQQLTGQAGNNAIDPLIASVRPGCDGLECWPFLAGSTISGRAPDPVGRLSGLRLSHGPAHVLRAVIEGLGFELNRHLELLCRAGTPVARLIAVGGAAGSRVTPQILADITGRTVDCPDNVEGSLRGAVMLARALVEPSAELEQLSEELAPPARTMEPSGNAAVYAKLYRRYLEASAGEQADPS